MIGSDVAVAWDVARLTAPLSSWDGVERFRGVLADGREVTVLSYPALLGPLEIGDEVVVNVTALVKDLGTGGDAFAAAVPARARGSSGAAGAEHLVKARYTPFQAVVPCVDDPAAPTYPAMRQATSLGGMPVVVADLHSALPAVLAGVRAGDPALRVAYVLDDGAALPAWYSRTVAELRAADWIVGCIAAGQAFGGDLDAVTVHSALLAARHVLHADVAVVIQGPGNLGTGTPFGFSGLRSGEAANAAAALGGRPIGVLRVSAADARDRHRGLSHHSATTYRVAALAPVDLVTLAPSPATPPIGEAVGRELRDLLAGAPRHRVVELEADGLHEALRTSPVRLSTMGRDLAADAAPFLWAAAAGRHAARCLPEPSGPR